MTTEEALSFCAIGRDVIRQEIDGLTHLLSQVTDQFSGACQCLLNCKGKVVVTGMGKSGHIGRKIAATFSSTGTPSLFLHPAEAVHGDVGLLDSSDVLLVISYSGRTDEVLVFLPRVKRLGVPMIVLTGCPNSELARAADICLDLGITREACPFNLAPTTSATATLVFGDALAIALLKARGFTPEDFALRHPAGSLGRRLLWCIADVMRTGERIPKVLPDTPLTRALLEVSKKCLGMTAVVDAADRVLGIFTDGDLRRALDRGCNVHQTLIKDVMTSPCITVSKDLLVAGAIDIMERRNIRSFLVVDENQTLIGALDNHDLTRAGIL